MKKTRIILWQFLDNLIRPLQQEFIHFNTHSHTHTKKKQDFPNLVSLSNQSPIVIVFLFVDENCYRMELPRFITTTPPRFERNVDAVDFCVPHLTVWSISMTHWKRIQRFTRLSWLPSQNSAETKIYATQKWFRLPTYRLWRASTNRPIRSNWFSSC